MNKFSYKQKILGALLSLTTMSFFWAMTGSQVWANTMYLTPTHDTYIAWNQTIVNPTGDVNTQNYGSASGLSVGTFTYPTVPVSWGWNYRYRSLLQFDLSSIPSGLNITSVSLELQIFSYSPSSIPTIDLHRMSDDGWDEASITWNSAPSAFTAASVSGALDTLSLDNWLWTFNLDSWNMAEDLGDGKVTFILKDQNDQTITPSRSLSFYSSEGSAAPRLVIEYDSQVPIPGSFLLLGSGFLGLGAWRRFSKK